MFLSLCVFFWVFFFLFYQFIATLHPCAHAQSCNPVVCSPPASSVHGFFQARILEWVAISFSSLFCFLNIYLFVFGCAESLLLCGLFSRRDEQGLLS